MMASKKKEDAKGETRKMEYNAVDLGHNGDDEEFVL